jgi:HEAT repeat protein
MALSLTLVVARVEARQSSATKGQKQAGGQEQPRAAESVDSRLVGTWELGVQGTWTWVWKIDAKGKYEFIIEGPGDLPGHSGTLEARDGKWKLQSTAGTQWTDGGTFQFVDRDTVSMTGNLGTATWKRRAAATQKRKKPGTEQPAAKSKSTDAADSPPGKPAAGKQPESDPGLIGVWQGTLAAAKVTFEFTASGQFKLTAQGPDGSAEQSGDFQAADGKWKLELTTGDFEGTYRLVDRNTLDWTDPRDNETVRLKRFASAGKKATPDQAGSRPAPGKMKRPDPAAGKTGKSQSIPRPITLDDLDTVPKLIDLLGSSDSSHRELAAYRLGVMAREDREAAAEAVPGLIETLSDRMPVTRANAAIALGNIGAGAEAAVPTLAKLLRDQDHRPRDAAAKALGQIASEPETAVPALARALQDQDAGVRSQAALSLGQFGADAAPAAAALGDALSDPAPGVSQTAVQALAKLGASAEEATPALAKALSNRNLQLREAAAKTLGQIGPQAKAAVPALTAALRDRMANVASAAALALGSIGDAARPAVPALIQALKNPAVAASAAQVLCHFPHDAATAVPAIVEHLASTEGDRNLGYARGQVIQSLGALGPSAQPAVPMLVRILRNNEEHSDNRQAAAEVLKQIGPAAKEAVAPLIEHLKDKNATPQSRCDAAAVLGSLGPAAKSAVPALQQVVNDNFDRSDVRSDAAKALEAIRGASKPQSHKGPASPTR